MNVILVINDSFRRDHLGCYAVEEVTFGALLEDNPQNLVHLFDQFYWAEDLV